MYLCVFFCDHWFIVGFSYVDLCMCLCDYCVSARASTDYYVQSINWQQQHSFFQQIKQQINEAQVEYKKSDSRAHKPPPSPLAFDLFACLFDCLYIVWYYSVTDALRRSFHLSLNKNSFTVRQTVDVSFIYVWIVGNDSCASRSHSI